MSKILVVPDVHGRDFWKGPCQEWQGSIVFLGDYHDPYPYQVSQHRSRKNLEELVEFYEENSNKIKNLIERLDPKLIYQIGDVLFSHAGVLPEWLDANNITLEDLKTMNFSHLALWDISPLRGGYGCEVGGCLWGDVREYASHPHLEGIYQVFGHTQLEKDPIIEEDYADLDNRECYIIDTETHEIQQYAKVS